MTEASPDYNINTRCGKRVTVGETLQKLCRGPLAASRVFCCFPSLYLFPVAEMQSSCERAEEEHLKITESGMCDNFQ